MTKQTHTTTAKTILDRFPSPAWLAENLGVRPVTVRNWINRKPHKIPSRYWEEITDLAKMNGIEVSVDELFAMERQAPTEVSA